MFLVDKVDWYDHKDSLSLIRTRVFIEEQHVPVELEWDGLDENAIHVLATDENKNPVGTGRLLDTGQIGRMAVLKAWRGQGIGSAILQCLIDIALVKNYSTVFLNAQVSVEGFYQMHGFTAVGDVFDDAAIPHRKMIYK